MKAKWQIDNLDKSFKRFVNPQAQTTLGLWYILMGKMGLVDKEWQTQALGKLQHKFLEYIYSPT